YFGVYVSNSAWGENISLWIIIAHLHGFRFDWNSVFPRGRLAFTAPATVLLFLLLSVEFYRTYRRLWSWVSVLAVEHRRRRSAVGSAVLLLGAALLSDAHYSPGEWFGEPVTNFFGWPAMSSVMGFDAIRAAAAAEDLAAAREYAPKVEFERRNVVVIVV